MLFRILLLILGLAAVTTAEAEPNVRANLNRLTSVIGDPVELEIKVSGAHKVGNPPEIAVDGLDIQFLNKGNEQLVHIENGNMSSEEAITLTYQVVPQRNGAFTIPPIAVEADGKTYTTRAIALNVQPTTANGEFDTDKISFAEIFVPKKTLYVGEALPLELRLYVDSRIRWEPVAMPDIDGEGFTKQKMPEPHKADTVERKGRDFDMLVFKTIISPIRAGELTIGPSEIPFRAQVPHARPNGGRSPFDIFGDVFSDPFYAVTQKLKAKAESIQLTVKSLPLVGKPSEFSGAVGSFELSGEGTPKQVKIGDPITMRMRVSGHGNFDRVSAPVIGDTTGWRSYPPSSTFNGDDVLSYSGTKTFEEAVIPETKKSTLPVFYFSYFDPVKGRYFTLNTEASPLLVEGSAPPAPNPVAPATDSTAPAPAPAPQPEDIVGLRYDHDEPRAFAPLYEHKEFWFAQGAIAVILLGWAALRIRRRPDALALQKTALRHEKDAAWQQLRRASLADADFFDAAARVAQIDTALATGGAVSSIDAAAVCSSVNLDAEAAETINEIFNARAELHYAGSGGGGGQVPASRRERVLEVLRQLEKEHARN